MVDLINWVAIKNTRSLIPSLPQKSHHEYKLDSKASKENF